MMTKRKKEKTAKDTQLYKGKQIIPFTYKVKHY